MTKSEEKRELILKSANHLLANNGLSDITIDAVAKHAGYSKGGVMHYFPNKNTLLLSLADYLNKTYFDRIENFCIQDSNIIGRWSRGAIQVADNDLSSTSEANIALVAGSLAKDQLSNEFLNSFNLMQSKMANDGYDPVLATIIRLTIDGLYYSELFNASPLDDKLRNKVLHRLRNWTYIEFTKK